VTAGRPASRLADRRRALRHGLTVVCLAVLAYYVYLYRAEFRSALVRLDLAATAVAMLTIALQILTRAGRDRILYRSMGSDVPLGVVHSINVRQNLLNYLPMKAGTIYAAAELKTSHGVGLGRYAAAFAAQSAFTLATTLLLAGIAVWLDEPGAHPLAAAVLALAGLLTLLVLTVRVPDRFPLPRRLRTGVETVHEGMDLLLRQRRGLAAAALLSVAAVLLSAWRFQVLVAAGWGPVEYWDGLAFAVGAQASLFVGLTPAGIGVREAVVGGVASLLELPATAGVFASAMDRVLVLAYCGAMALLHAVVPARHGAR